MENIYCENCPCFMSDLGNSKVYGYCTKYDTELYFYDWFIKCEQCFEE